MQILGQISEITPNQTILSHAKGNTQNLGVVPKKYLKNNISKVTVKCCNNYEESLETTEISARAFFAEIIDETPQDILKKTPRGSPGKIEKIPETHRRSTSKRTF